MPPTLVCCYIHNYCIRRIATSTVSLLAKACFPVKTSMPVVNSTNVSMTSRRKDAILPKSQNVSKLQYKQKIVAGQLVEPGRTGNPYEDIPILEPRESLDDESSELSEGARLWFGQLVEKAEHGELDRNEVFDSPKSIRDQIAEDENLILDQDGKPYVGMDTLVSLEESRIIPLKVAVPVPRRRLPEKTYTAAPLVNHSETLQKLIEIGVNLSVVEKMDNAMDILVKCNYARDIEPVLQFLGGICGLAASDLGTYITKNPWIFQQRLEDLEVRHNYLQSKRFTSGAIIVIITKAVYWLNLKVKTIDSRLGWLQREFDLTGDDVRLVVSQAPELITFGIGYAQMLEFSLHEEMGFTVADMKRLIVKCPRVFLRKRESVLATFHFVQNELGFSHSRVLDWPYILRYDNHHIQTRHSFLKSLDRNQYDSTLPNFVSLERLVRTTDKMFAVEVAKSSISDYNKFMKSL